MPTELVAYVLAGWVALAAAVVMLALYRRWVARGEYDALHVRDSESVQIPQQDLFARRLNRIDSLGKILTAVAIAYGLVLAGTYLYQHWQQGNQIRY